MEQITELFEILKSTPELALWGLVVWCLYILAKLASVVWALQKVSSLAINKWHDFKIKNLSLEENAGHIKSIKILADKEKELLSLQEHLLQEKEGLIKKEFRMSGISKLAKRFEKESISDVDLDELKRVIDLIKGDSMYIHMRHIKEAIKKLEK